MSTHREFYQGFEQGPIRPPSESRSLLIRVTRNCPWNRCLFCPLYTNKTFSLRSVEHIKKDIDQVSHYLTLFQQHNNPQKEKEETFSPIRFAQGDALALQAAYQWHRFNRKSIFLQDSDALIFPTDELLQILQYLKQKFPENKRITSYARSATLTKRSSDDLKRLKRAGLTRIHIGLESGSDKILHIVRKGVTKQDHISAGVKVKQAGIELSEYVMPGLGGSDLSYEHIMETSDALNQINPDYIRLRQLALPPKIPLYKTYRNETFHPCNDILIVKELSLLLDNLQGVTSIITSDHILNLFANFEGKLPKDKKRLQRILHDFSHLSIQKQMEYRVGRRLGLYATLQDLEKSFLLKKVTQFMKDSCITSNNIDAFIEDLMQRFI